MTSEERESLVDQRRELQGGWMKYNYLTTHPSWQSSKTHRRRETMLLKAHGIKIFDDALTTQEPETMDTDGEEEEEEEEEKQENTESDDDDDEPILYPSFEPKRASVIYRDY
eukprot:TRINITY_DN4839_c0_g3_i2.p2 TRINITY_DN4839_c0_g3~~TRINITY_DN4839_c0_g3_i2.p2  ORF type:complete len:112 (+),score=29.94 TRINITY_DN4839_c0_g3_i2:385-720(+)